MMTLMLDGDSRKESIAKFGIPLREESTVYRDNNRPQSFSTLTPVSDSRLGASHHLINGTHIFGEFRKLTGSITPLCLDSVIYDQYSLYKGVNVRCEHQRRLEIKEIGSPSCFRPPVHISQSCEKLHTRPIPWFLANMWEITTTLGKTQI